MPSIRKDRGLHRSRAVDRFRLKEGFWAASQRKGMEKQTDKIKIKEEEGERGGKEGSYRASIAFFFSFFFFFLFVERICFCSLPMPRFGAACPRNARTLLRTRCSRVRVKYTSVTKLRLTICRFVEKNHRESAGVDRRELPEFEKPRVAQHQLSLSRSPTPSLSSSLGSSPYMSANFRNLGPKFDK